MASVILWLGATDLESVLDDPRGLLALLFAPAILIFGLIAIVVSVRKLIAAEPQSEGASQQAIPGLGRRKEHDVVVHDVRPDPDQREDFEPYFVAICECGWLGDVRGSAQEAFRDAHGHSPRVAAEVTRPVG